MERLAELKKKVFLLLSFSVGIAIGQAWYFVNYLY